MPVPTIAPTISANDAVKVDSMCARILGDVGSVYKRAFPGSTMPPELVELRRFLREVQDAVRDVNPEAFYK